MGFHYYLDKHIYKVSGDPRPRMKGTIGRTWHLADVENLAGGSGPDQVTLGEVFNVYYKAAGFRPGDLTTVACNPALGVRVKAALRGVDLRVRRGKDGADLALLDAMADVEWVAYRFDRVVLGSGDGIFYEKVRELQAAGVAVGIVGRRGCIARSLWYAADYRANIWEDSMEEMAA